MKKIKVELLKGGRGRENGIRSQSLELQGGSCGHIPNQFSPCRNSLFDFPQFSCCTKMWREYISPNSSLLGLTICMGNSHTKQFGSIPPKGQLPVKEESPEKTTTRWQSLPGQLKEKTEIPPDEGKTDTGENENRKRPGGFGC